MKVIISFLILLVITVTGLTSTILVHRLDGTICFVEGKKDIPLGELKAQGYNIQPGKDYYHEYTLMKTYTKVNIFKLDTKIDTVKSNLMSKNQ